MKQRQVYHVVEVDEEALLVAHLECSLGSLDYLAHPAFHSLGPDCADLGFQAEVVYHLFPCVGVLDAGVDSDVAVAVGLAGYAEAMIFGKPDELFDNGLRPHDWLVPVMAAQQVLENKVNLAAVGPELRADVLSINAAPERMSGSGLRA